MLSLELVFFQSLVPFELVVFAKNSAHVLVKFFQLSLRHCVLLAHDILRRHVHILIFTFNIDFVGVQQFLNLKLMDLFFLASHVLLHSFDGLVELFDLVVSFLVFVVITLHNHISLNKLFLDLNLLSQR